MSPVTSFTASLGHDGRIDIFALALGPQVPVGRGVTVWRARQAAPGGGWPTWVNEGSQAQGRSGCEASSTLRVEGMSWPRRAVRICGSRSAARPMPSPDGSPWASRQLTSLTTNWGFIYMWGATRADGQIDVVGTANSNSDRGIFHRSRPAPGAPWSEWSHLLGDNDFFGDVTAATAYDGGLDIVTPIEVFPSKDIPGA